MVLHSTTINATSNTTGEGEAGDGDDDNYHHEQQAIGPKKWSDKYKDDLLKTADAILKALDDADPKELIKEQLLEALIGGEESAGLDYLVVELRGCVRAGRHALSHAPTLSLAPRASLVRQGEWWLQDGQRMAERFRKGAWLGFQRGPGTPREVG